LIAHDNIRPPPPPKKKTKKKTKSKDFWKKTTPDN
jgi:hypothetical protein